MGLFIKRSTPIALLSLLTLCSFIGLPAQTAGGDDSSLRDIPKTFAPFEYLVGRWKGTGVPKEKSAQQFRGWTETHAWAWIFEKGKPVGLSVTIEGGRIFSDGKLIYDSARQKYRLEATDVKPAGGRIAFEGTLGNGPVKELVLDRVGPSAKSGKVRLRIWPNPNFIRYTMKQERQEPGAVQLSPATEVGLTKEGESLAGGGTAADGPKCIVTGGAATMTLTFQGKTFPICCTGCRDEFNESPEKYLKKASLLSSQAGQAKSNQPVSAKVSRFEDAFAGDIPPSAAEPSRMSNRQTVTKPELKKPAEKSEPAANAEVSAKVKSPNKNSTDKSAAAKRISRAATLLQIAQNLENHGKAEAALKNFKQIVKDFPGTPAAKTAAERIKALDVD
jgi:YHS domain-containing protein